MKGVVFVGDRRLEIREFPDPAPGPRDVILEIKASGMCGSDLHRYRAPFNPGDTSSGFKMADEPVIAGHEPCGVVVELGSSIDKHEVTIGQRVMDHHYEGCGNCKHCKGGWQQMCLDGTTVFGASGHGAHAKYMRVPISTLVPLPNELSFTAGAAISCGTGTAFGALRRLKIQGGETLAIFGQGPVGLSATQLATAMGAKVIALDISPERLKMAKAFGADTIIDSRSNDPVTAIRDLTNGEGAHKTLDASSAPSARQSAVQAVRSWGTACYVGETGNVMLEVSPDMLRRQVTLVGSWTFSTQGQSDCAEFIVDNNIDVEKLFTDKWTLDQAAEAYERFDKQDSGKGVIIPA